MTDWHVLQDDIITGSLTALKELYDNDSPLYRIDSISESCLMEKHLYNVFLLRKASERFRLLDLGCGEGRLLYRLKDFYSDAEFTGIDSNVQSISNARTRLGDGVSLYCEKFDDSLSHGKFDVVICSEVFEHVEEFEKLLDTLSLLVKRGGCLSISTPSGFIYRTPRLINLARLIFRFKKFKLDLYPELNWKEAVKRHPAIQPKKLIKMLKQRGFKMLSRQSSLWMMWKWGIVFRILRWFEKYNKIETARFLCNLVLLLDSLMNLIPIFRIFESRFVLLLEKVEGE